MAPRRGRLLRDPLPPPEASSRPSYQPEMQQDAMESDARLPDSYLDPIKVQLLSPRTAESDNSNQPAPFEWDKRLDDKRQYERQRYLRHHFPHHRLSHNIFDVLMLDTAHDLSLSRRSVPAQLVPSEEAKDIDGENVVSSGFHIAVASQQSSLPDQKTRTDEHTEIETQKLRDSSSSSPLTHQSPSTYKHNHDNNTPPQQPITPCTNNSTDASKPTKTPLQIHPVADQIIFQHPHDRSTSSHTTTHHSINHTTTTHGIANTSTSPSKEDTTHSASLAIFICIICFFICGWQASISWRDLQQRRRRRRRHHRCRHVQRGEGRQRQQDGRSDRTGRGGEMYTDDPEMAAGMVEMVDLVPYADGHDGDAVDSVGDLIGGGGEEEEGNGKGIGTLKKETLKKETLEEETDAQGCIL